MTALHTEGFVPIAGNWVYGWEAEDDLTQVDWDDWDGIAELLVGRKVTKVSKDHLLLDDGTVLKVVPNDGGCSCGAGDYELTALNGVDNIITSVDVVETAKGDERYEPDRVFEVFVFADNQRINLLTIEGNDGNGYYGTGYRFLVRRPA